MPDSGNDPQQSGSLLDGSGGGSDTSLYQLLSPGGRFYGDISNYLGFIQAKNTGGQLGNGNEDVSNIQLPSNYGKLISALLNGLVNNARQGGAGQAPGNPLTDGGYPFQLYSGPGASFGPKGGSLNGLLDQGNLSPVDGTDNPFNHLDTAGIPTDNGGGKKGGGGGGGSFSFTPYGGVPFTASFVGYSPTQPGAVQHAAPIIQSLVNSGSITAPPSSPGKQGGGSGSGTGGSGSGGGGHRAPTWQVGGTPPAIPTGGIQRPDGRIIDKNGNTIWAPAPGQKVTSGGGGPGSGNAGASTNPTGAGQFGGVLPQGGIPANLFGPGINGPAGTTPTDRDSRGVNFNNLDKGTPGWLRDPTQGIQNTAGMPLPTLPDPKGMTADQYITLLHDLGFTQEDIAGVVSNYGFNIGNPQAGPPSPDGHNPGDADNVSFGWGTGPVVRGANGYMFANGSGGGGNGRSQQTPNAATTLNSGANAWWMTR